MPFVNAPFAVSSTSMATRLAGRRFRYASSTGAIWMFIAWTVALVHTTETGAIEPGGMPVSAISRFEEGMNLPPMRIGDNFQLLRDDPLRQLLRVRRVGLVIDREDGDLAPVPEPATRIQLADRESDATELVETVRRLLPALRPFYRNEQRWRRR